MNATQTMEKAVPAPLGLLMRILQIKLMETKSIMQELYRWQTTGEETYAAAQKMSIMRGHMKASSTVQIKEKESTKGTFEYRELTITQYFQ